MSGTMDTAGVLFNGRFDNKALRNELLNKKEERTKITTGVVKRYRPGVVPDFAKKKDEQIPRKKIEASFDIDESYFEKKADPRLERLQAAQKSRRRPSQRVHAETELILDESEEEEQLPSIKAALDVSAKQSKDNDLNIHLDHATMETKEDDEELAIRRRKMLLSRANEEAEMEEMGVMEEEDNQVLPKLSGQGITSKDDDDEEYEYEYEEYEESEDEGTRFALRHCPTFIPKVGLGDNMTKKTLLSDLQFKANRKTIESEDEKARKAKELEELEDLKYQQRVEQTKRMIEEVRIQELEEEENRGKRMDPRTAEEIPDDTDDLENEAELEAWKWREFNRIIREREREKERVMEEEEKERRAHMTDAEIERDNNYLEEHGIRKSHKKPQLTPEERSKKVTFLQKYYHKGVFYMDDESIHMSDDVRNRDYHERTERDRRDLANLPKAMQVRDFGKRSQSKWTYLRNEDTTASTAKDDLYKQREKNIKRMQEQSEKKR